MVIRHRPTLALTATLCSAFLAACGGEAGRPSGTPVNVAALPSLIRELKLKDPASRARSAMAIGQMGPAAREAVPPLIDALKDRDLGVRGAAAYALGQIGPDARTALPALGSLKQQKALRDIASNAMKDIDR